MKYAIFKDIVTVQGHGAVLLLQVGSTALCLGNSGQSTEGAILEIRLFAPMAEKRFTIKWRGLTSRALDAGQGCPSCERGLCPNGSGGFIPCTICGNTGQPKDAPRQ